MIAILGIIPVMLGIYLGFCVESNPYSMMGRIKLKTIDLFSKLSEFLPSHIRQMLIQIYRYCFYQRNPIIEILYLCLVAALFAIYLICGIHQYFPHPYIHIYYIYFGYFLLIFCLVCFYIACSVGPGIITKNNYQAMNAKYPHIPLYHDRSLCTKCKIIKIPRSKHCTVCDMCIEKFDHHCIWVNQCIGANNYRFFLLFLIVHLILCSYAAIIGVMILYYFILQNNLINATFYSRETFEMIPATYYTILKYVISKNYSFFSSIVVLITISVTLILFIIYHIFLISKNFTTTEKNKAKKMQRFMSIIRDTMVQIAKEKEMTLSFTELTPEEIMRYHDIAFNNPEYDLSKLSETEVNSFYNFADHSMAAYGKNLYYKGFFAYLYDIIRGR